MNTLKNFIASTETFIFSDLTRDSLTRLIHKHPFSDVLFTTSAYSRRRGHFVTSAFPNKKNLAQKSKFIHDKQI